MEELIANHDAVLVSTGCWSLHLPDLPGLGELSAKVTRVDRVLDAASNTFRARLELPNPDYAIPAGLRCKARFSAAQHAAIRHSGPAPKAAAEDRLPALMLDTTLSVGKPRSGQRTLRKQM